MRIAVVDDSSLVLDVVREALERAGFVVTCARDTDEALRADADLLVADASLRARLPVDKLRVLNKEDGLGRSLSRAVGGVVAVSGPLMTRYRARFYVLARRRLARALDLFEGIVGGGIEELARELQTMTGEAQLLELHEFAELAQSAEAHVLEWVSRGEFADLTRFAQRLNTMCVALHGLLTLPDR